MTVQILLICILASSIAEARAPDETVTAIPFGGSAWHVACADVTGDGRSEMIGACYDGSVRVLRWKDHAEIWRHDGRAFPYDLAVDDLTGDGRAEVLVAAADGTLQALAPDGRPIWNLTCEVPLYQVAIANVGGSKRIFAGGVDRNLYMLDADGKRLRSLPFENVIRLVRTGDLTGDGVDEVVVGLSTGELFALRTPTLERLWRVRLTEADPKRRRTWYPFSLHVADLDGDGRSELLLGACYHNRFGIRVMSGEGTLLWDQSDGFEFRDGSGGSQSMLMAMEVDPEQDGVEVLALNGRRLFLFDRKGRLLRTGISPLGFTNLSMGPVHEDGPSVLLGSSPNGDDQVYHVRLRGRWDRAMMRMEREGKMRRIMENLEHVRRQIAAYQGTAERDARYVHVVSAGQPDTPQRLASMFKTVDFYRKRFPYPNCEFAVTITLATDEPIDGFTLRAKQVHERRLRPSQVPGLLAACEQAGVPFFVSVGHNCEPMISLATAEAILAICPKTCLGFLSSENMDYADRLDRYLERFWYPLMDLCKQHGKKAVLVEKCAWWMGISAMSRFRKLVDGTYADVLVMSVEDANSRSPELQLSARVGLLLSGKVRRMSARTVADEMIWNRLWQWQSAMTGHPFLRRQMVQALLGAEMFEHQLRNHDPEQPGTFSVIGSESTELLLDMIGKGLLKPPKPKEMLGLSPCSIRIHEPRSTFLREAFGGRVSDEYEAGAEDRQSLFEGLIGYRGGAPTAPHYLGSYLFQQDRHALNFIPATPYGFAAIVPSFIEKRPGESQACMVETDGQYILDGSKRLTGAEGMQRVRSLFESNARAMLIQVTGHVFTQVQRLDEDRLRITIIDSGYLDPDDRAVSIRIRDDLASGLLVDVLSGQTISIKDGSASIVVPAGVFRILELRGRKG